MRNIICFSNYPIGDKIADFVVLTSRSKMKVCIVEVKGADFKIVKANHYQGLNVYMNDAITQIKKSYGIHKQKLQFIQNPDT